MKRKDKQYLYVRGFALLTAIAIPIVYAVGTSKSKQTEPLDIQTTTDIRVVYQIKTDEWKDGIGSGLHYVRKLYKAYQTMEIPASELDIHAVLQGDAGYWLLKDELYRVHAQRGNEANPNKNIVANLIDNDINIELCAQTMKKHGWNHTDILPGVTIVAGAYPRIIDLQFNGCAYIRF